MQAFLHFQVSVQVQGRRYAALNVLRTALSRLTGMTQVQWQSILTAQSLYTFLPPPSTRGCEWERERERGR